MPEKFTDDQLMYAAHKRCKCGAGLAYPMNIGPGGAWYCSAVLKSGQAETSVDAETISLEDGTEHSKGYPFFMYEIKSEIQPSQRGATTRESGIVHHVDCGEPVWKCRCGTRRDLEVRYS